LRTHLAERTNGRNKIYELARGTGLEALPTLAQQFGPSRLRSRETFGPHRLRRCAKPAKNVPTRKSRKLPNYRFTNSARVRIIVPIIDIMNNNGGANADISANTRRNLGRPRIFVDRAFSSKENRMIDQPAEFTGSKPALLIVDRRVNSVRRVSIVSTTIDGELICFVVAKPCFET
jgi:hypothetical protein